MICLYLGQIKQRKVDDLAAMQNIKWRLSLVALILCTMLGSSCVQSNNSPVINKLQPQKDTVTPSGSCIMVSVASDADGDILTYTWSATEGTFSGAGPVVTWKAPHTPGTYTIIVKVTDGRGGKATRQLTMKVQVNQPPVVESLTAEPPVVKQGESTTIVCVASDPDGDELSYQWVATKGNISGQGSTVIWTGPDKCGNYIITVTATDGKDGEASRKLTIEVKKPG